MSRKDDSHPSQDEVEYYLSRGLLVQDWWKPVTEGLTLSRVFLPLEVMRRKTRKFGHTNSITFIGTVWMYIAFMCTIVFVILMPTRNVVFGIIFAVCAIGLTLSYLGVYVRVLSYIALESAREILRERHIDPASITSRWQIADLLEDLARGR